MQQGNWGFSKENRSGPDFLCSQENRDEVPINYHRPD
jgi:hypothetical protein